MPGTIPSARDATATSTSGSHGACSSVWEGEEINECHDRCQTVTDAIKKNKVGYKDRFYGALQAPRKSLDAIPSVMGSHRGL